VKNKGSFCCKSFSNSKFIHGDEDENIMENDDQRKRLEERSTDGGSRQKLSMEKKLTRCLMSSLISKNSVFLWQIKDEMTMRKTGKNKVAARQSQQFTKGKY
jgi:hypothetical protein